MYVLFFSLALMVAAVLLHYMASDHVGAQKTLQRSVAVTRMASAAVSVAWFEPRLRRYEYMHNPAYPELMAPDRLGFVYGERYER
jgi:hypothetical protein